MTRLEMIQKLAENPKRKGENISNGLICIVDKSGKVVYEDGDTFLIYVCNDKSDWEIIEPPKELRKMSFGEAMYRLTKKNDWYYEDMKQVDTNFDATRDWDKISFEEYTGLWTVEGIYEEEAP